MPAEFATWPREDAGGRARHPRPGRLSHPPRLRRLARRRVRARIRGATYQEIAARGGGIASTVRAHPRSLEADALHRRARGFLSAMAALGVTTVECKSGYGLEQRDRAPPAARSTSGWPRRGRSGSCRRCSRRTWCRPSTGSAATSTWHSWPTRSCPRSGPATSPDSATCSSRKARSRWRRRDGSSPPARRTASVPSSTPTSSPRSAGPSWPARWARPRPITWSTSPRPAFRRCAPRAPWR